VAAGVSRARLCCGRHHLVQRASFLEYNTEKLIGNSFALLHSQVQPSCSCTTLKLRRRRLTQLTDFFLGSNTVEAVPSGESMVGAWTVGSHLLKRDLAVVSATTKSTTSTPDLAHRCTIIAPGVEDICNYGYPTSELSRKQAS